MNYHKLNFRFKTKIMEENIKTFYKFNYTTN